jgi:hypothetical protein
MAPTTDTQGLRFRAVFAQREPSRTTRADLSDLQSAVTQLDALFKVAWAISDPDTLRLEAELRSRFPRGTCAASLPSPPAPLPQLRSLAMQSPLDLLAEIPGEFVWGGGAVAALSVLIERALNLPLRIQVQREKLRAEKAGWEAARTKSELSVIAQQAEALKALTSANLEVRSVELFNADNDQHEAATDA